MSLTHGLLGLLSYSSMTGYDLGKAFQDSLSFFWKAQPSQIYRELNKLEAQGCLTSNIEIQIDKPNKRVYTITESGRAVLSAWLSTSMPDELMSTRSEILMRLFFSAEKNPADTISDLKHVEAMYQDYTAQMGQLNLVIDGYKTFAKSEMDAIYWELTADFGRAYTDMCATWVRHCIKRLEEVTVQ